MACLLLLLYINVDSNRTTDINDLPRQASKVILGMRNNLPMLSNFSDNGITRRGICRLLLWVPFAFSLAPATSSAHLLNMTEIHLDATQPNSVKLEIDIDLGQSLMTAEEYWSAASSDLNNQAEVLRPIASQIESGLQVKVDGSAVSFELDSWQLTASSLQAINNPFSPQMAQLFFRLEAPIPADASVELLIDDQLEVPWPALVRVDHSASLLPTSRLLTERERSSRPIFFGEKAASTEGETLSTKAVLAVQALAPGLEWIALGFQHIIPRGLDHIVFVLGLFFLSTGVRQLILQVSCFTVAHSLTLGLATFGIVSVPASIVEPLIAASIVCIALDNLHSEKIARWRLLMVTLFGLLHGLGFASVLSDLDLPPQDFLSSLLLFNLGVEVGQLTVLAIAFIAVGWMQRWAQYAKRVARPATITIAGIGAYWFIKRVSVI